MSVAPKEDEVALRADNSSLRRQCNEAIEVIHDLSVAYEKLKEENRELLARLGLLEKENIDLLFRLREANRPREKSKPIFFQSEDDETEIAKADRALRLEKVDEE